MKAQLEGERRMDGEREGGGRREGGRGKERRRWLRAGWIEEGRGGEKERKKDSR